MTRYTFDEVRAALRVHWGLSLHRGGELTDLGKDGRWDTAYSKTGYVVGGSLPRRGYGHQRFRSLNAVARNYDLTSVVARGRS